MTIARSMLSTSFVAAALFVAGCGGGHETAQASAKPAGAPPVPVRVARAEKRDVPVRVRALGTVEPPASVVIKPRVAGEVADVKLEEGKDVAAGDLIVVLDERPFRAALQASEAVLARDQALARDAQRNWEQWQSLPDKKAVAQRTIEQAETAAEAAKAAVRIDEAEVENRRLELEYCSIRAPFAGRTGRIAVRKGSAVKANETELVTIHQLDPIRVAFSVPSSRLPEIRAQLARPEEGSLPVEVALPGGGSAKSVLDFVDNQVALATGTVRLMATFENAKRGLWPGQLVDVALTVRVEKDAVVVPARAVQMGQQGSYVFVVGPDQKVELRDVVAERSDTDTMLVRKGLDGGETVVTDGQLRLAPGSRAQVVEDAKTKP